MLKRSERILICLIFVSFVLYFASTVIGNAYAMNIMSPVTVFCVFVLLVSELGRLGPFKWSSVAMAGGIFTWFVGDILFFLNEHVVTDNVLLGHVTDYIYYLPNGFFAVCITIYMISMLKDKRSEQAFLMTNTFCFAIIGFVIIYRYHMYATGAHPGLAHWKELLFFFVSFYTIMMCAQLFSYIGWESIFKGTVSTNVGVLGYAVLDIEYDFVHSLGLDAENDFSNLLYVFFIVLMGVGTTIQINRNYIFEFKKVDFSKDATRKRSYLAIVFIIATIISVAMGVMPLLLGLFVLITLLSYLITNFILHSGYLNEKLIEQERKQKILLEQEIANKTQDLEDANNKLKEKTNALEFANENLLILSSTDILTGLKNRRNSVHFIQNLWHESKNNNKKFAVFCIDLNHFKPINDTYGHEMGDRVLAEFGRRLNNLPEGFTSFRMGGDEFLVCYENLEDESQADWVADTLRKLFNTPIIYDTYIFNLSASIGGAIYPNDSEDYNTLIKYADTAMYDVKNSFSKDGYKFFNPRMTEIIDRKKAITDAVSNAVADRDFILYYQPQINADTCEIQGFEVFPHLKGDMEDVSPSDLVPIAEECGLMSSLGNWIAKSALADITELNKRFDKNVGFTINLSPLQLADADFMEALKGLTSEYGFDTEKITLDISNEVIMGATASAKNTLAEFHNYGFRLSLNDFGGKNLNLSYLMECKIDYIKLSRNLISGIEDDEKNRLLINAIVSLATTMGISVIAVGIEKENEMEILRQMGIQLMQGYLISKPAQKEEIEELLKNRESE